MARNVGEYQRRNYQLTNETIPWLNARKVITIMNSFTSKISIEY
jgi:hypothetical protein